MSTLDNYFHALDWRLKSYHEWFRSLAIMVREEINHPHKDLTLREKLRIWRYGLMSESYVLYGLRDKEPDAVHDYLPDMARFLKPGHINGWYKHVLQDKLVFAASMAFNDHHYVPKIHAQIFHGRIRPLQGTIASLDELIQHCNNGNEVVLKPIKGSGGDGVLLLSAKSGGLSLSGNQINRENLKNRVLKLNAYLIQQAVKQSEYAQNIFPGSVNTIRIVTMWDSETERPFVAAAIHRFGTTKSMPVDNLDKGGISARIDLETGQLGPASPYLRGNDLVWHAQHPDTQENIEGIQVPGWSDIKKRILEVAEKFPQLPYVGWDVLLDSNDQLTVLEGNVKPGIWVLQMHEPLLSNPKVRRFYREHRII